MNLYAIPEVSLFVISLAFLGFLDVQKTIFSVLVVVGNLFVPNSKWKGFTLTMILAWQIFRKGLTPPKLFYQKNEQNERLLKQCPSLFTPFRPSFFLFNGHLQSMGTALRKNPNLLFKREEVHFSDGGYSALDWTENDFEVTPTTPTICILHGLAGGSSESYVRQFIVACQKMKWRTVVFNFRGAAGSTLKTPMGYCGAYTGDLKIVAAKVGEKLPNSPIFAIGYSLGANILAKYLGESGRKVPFKAAMTVSNPFDFYQSSLFLEHRFIGRVYSRYLTKGLLKFVERHMSVFEKSEHVEPKKILKEAKTLREFDDLATRRLFGYKSVDDYYRDASSKKYLSGVAVPYLALNALDDPVVPEDCLPYDEVVKNEHTILATTPFGGHVAFLKEGNLFKIEKSFMDEVAVEFFSSMLQKINEKQ